MYVADVVISNYCVDMLQSFICGTSRLRQIKYCDFFPSWVTTIYWGQCFFKGKHICPWRFSTYLCISLRSLPRCLPPSNCWCSWVDDITLTAKFNSCSVKVPKNTQYELTALHRPDVWLHFSGGACQVMYVEFLSSLYNNVTNFMLKCKSPVRPKHKNDI